MTTLRIQKVLIADDHAIFREGLKQVISRTLDLRVTSEVESGQEALRQVQYGDYDLVILDVSMPGRNGLDILGDIKRIRPRLPVLILSMYPEEQYALQALKAGASGYLTKGSPSEELVKALQRIALGKRYISPALAEALVEQPALDNEHPLHQNLSPREFQILCLIAAGTKPHQIAQDLAMSVKTVGTYRSRILKKMNMQSNADLTRYVTEHLR